MTITALTDLELLPNQSQDQATFDANMAYLLDNLPLRAQQENELAASMNAYAAGGAYAFQYVFDSSTTDSDPGMGTLRLNNATQNAATGLRIDNVMVGGADLSAVWADLLAVTSTIKGSIRIVKAGDPTKWMVLDVTGGTSPTGYRNLTATVRYSSATN